MSGTLLRAVGFIKAGMATKNAKSHKKENNSMVAGVTWLLGGGSGPPTFCAFLCFLWLFLFWTAGHERPHDAEGLVGVVLEQHQVGRGAGLQPPRRQAQQFTRSSTSHVERFRKAHFSVPQHEGEAGIGEDGGPGEV